MELDYLRKGISGLSQPLEQKGLERAFLESVSGEWGSRSLGAQTQWGIMGWSGFYNQRNAGLRCVHLQGAPGKVGN